MTDTSEDTGHYLYLKAIFIVALIAIAIVFTSYYLNFKGDISNKQELWGSFGDYIGGTLNPILSFLALLALLVTIAIQTKQLSLSRRELELTKIELAKTAEATSRQAKHLEKEAKRADIYRIIEIISARINNNYNKDRIEPIYMGQQGKISIHFVLKKGIDITANDMLQSIIDKYADESSDTHRTINWLENDLKRLIFYILEYEKATESSESSTPLPDFYKTEFGELVFNFHKLKMFDSDLFEFYCGP